MSIPTSGKIPFTKNKQPIVTFKDSKKTAMIIKSVPFDPIPEVPKYIARRHNLTKAKSTKNMRGSGTLNAKQKTQPEALIKMVQKMQMLAKMESMANTKAQGIKEENEGVVPLQNSILYIYIYIYYRTQNDIVILDPTKLRHNLDMGTQKYTKGSLNSYCSLPSFKKD